MLCNMNSGHVGYWTVNGC